MAQPLPNSTSSSSTPASSEKRTRDQPNLSECHSCLTRINQTCNPLEPLPSFWRIVLLCKKCIKNISHTCTYCLKPINNNINTVTCTLCNCRIHIECVASFKDTAPWRYLKGEFTVCVDCWIPNSLKKSVRRGDRDNGRFVFRRRTDAVQSMDDKELAVKIRNVFSSFPRIKRSEFCLDPIEVNVWRIKNWGGISYKRSRFVRDCNEGNRVTSNGLVTYKRDKNRKVCKIDDADVMVSESGSFRSGEKFELRMDEARTTRTTDVSNAVLCVDGDERGDRFISEEFIHVNSGIRVDRFGENLAIYKRSRFRGKGQVNGTTVYESGEGRVCDNHRQPDDEKDMTQLIVECEGNEILPNGSCNTEQDRYRLKYFKKVATTKSCSTRIHSGTVGCENKSPETALSNSETDSSFKCDGELRSPNENVRLDRYSLKYATRVKGSESGLNAEMKLHCESIQPE